MSEQESAAAADAADTEISLKAALERLLTDDSLADVTLKGNDGVEVPVNKGLLAARSEVFRALLYGNFAEGGESTVSIGYTGSVLKAVVEYIYTDRLARAEDARTAATIMEAANYFHLPGLCEKAKEIATEEMKSSPSMVFEYLSAGTELNVIDMEQSAMMCLRKSLPKIMGMEGAGESIQALAPPVVERILRDEDIQADEKTLFLLLKRWSDSGEYVGGRSRKEIASDLISHIRLDQIDPSALSELVVPTGLVADARLMEIFKAQAILVSSQNRGDALFNRKRKRGLCCWKQSTLVGQGETTLTLDINRPKAVHCLDTPGLTSGLHRWSIKVMDGSAGIFLGVVCPALAPAMMMETANINWSQMCDAAWLIEIKTGNKSHGMRINEGTNIPGSTRGSIVKCSLDLRQESSGTLSFCVGEDSQEHVVFEGMNSARVNNGLLPAIWSTGVGFLHGIPSKFEILSMESEE